MKKNVILVVSIIVMLTSVVFAQTPSNAGPIAGTTSVCANASAMYAVAEIPNATSYMWTLPAGATITSGFGTHSITVQFGNASGDVMVFGQHNTSFGNGSSFPVTVMTTPTVNLTAAPADICAGIPTVLTAISTTATSYAWSSGGINSTTTVTPTTTTTYTCTVNNGVCQGTGSVTVNVHAAPNVSLNLSTDKACHDIASLQLTGGSPLGGTYSSSGENIVYENNIVYPPINNPGTWTITYSITDAFGCTGSASDLFSINPIPVVMFNNIGGSLTVNTPNVNLNNYVTPQGGTFNGPGTTPGSSMLNFATAGTGTHMLTYTYTNPNTGCTASQIQYLTIAEIDTTGNGNGNGNGNGDGTGVDENKSTPIHIYPNPAKDKIRITTSINTTLQIFDALGTKQLEIKATEEEIDIDINNLSIGIYFVLSVDSKGKQQVQKLFKTN